MFCIATNPGVFEPNNQLAQANQSVLSPMNPVYDAKGSLSCTIKYPAGCKPVHITVADKMTVKETAMWIWTLGITHGWQEARCYSRSFQENDIAGDMLPELSLHRLKDDLGIRNHTHRMGIKCAIDLLFPNTKVNQFRALRAPAGIGLVDNIQESVMSMEEQASLRSTMSITSASVDYMSESVISTSTSSLRDNKMIRMVQGKKNIALKIRSLILTLRPDQRVTVEEMKQLKSRFAKFNYTVEILPYSKKPDSYVLVFDDEETAWKARAESAAIGYKLARYRDPRPGPFNIVRFRTLSNLTVRSGKSLQGRKIKMLKKNTVVMVNQTKGRRARIISFQNGKPVTFGWVSEISKNGIQLLERLE